MMEISKLPKYNKWLKDDSADCPPAGVPHICSYYLDLGMETVFGLLFLNRLRDIDKLWFVTLFPEKLSEEIDGNIPGYSEKTPTRVDGWTTPANSARREPGRGVQNNDRTLLPLS